ncbi:MAG: carboxylesterase family protein [Candidatus Adiutricales bacterium]
MSSSEINGGPIRMDSGVIRGSTTGQDDSISVYKGIPYAAPPVGELRWRPPAPVEPWKGIRPATEFGPAAPQGFSNFGGINEKVWQSEDCLFLNVWTPAKSPDERLPVMVWIHGGGFAIGSGSNPGYTGANLCEKGVVIVTINYRLNIFGAFAHPLLTKESGHNASGNYGLMDQVAALKWVQRNIRSFGGNPDRVTIFGESAGSRSVTLLVASPLSEGLFHGGICQSGATRDVSQSLEDREKEGIRTAEAVGARTLDELRSRTFSDFDAFLAFNSNPVGAFNSNPMVDGRVIPDDPRSIYAEGKQHRVSLIIGSNADEGTLGLGNTRIKTTEDFKSFIGHRYNENADEVHSLYAPDTDESVYEALNRHQTDRNMTLHARKQVRWMEKAGAKSYLYHFTRVPPTKVGQRLGSHHGAEIAYIFGNFGPGGDELTEIDRKLSWAMMTYWTQFAASGDPNYNRLPNWPAYRTENDAYLELGDDIKAGENLHKARLDVLDRLVK